MLDLLLNEDLWFPTATAVALLAVITLIARQWKLKITKRTKVACSLNLFYGLVIGIMGFGHLLAVTIKSVEGTLPASTNTWFVYPLGLALSIPAWLLVACVGGLRRGENAVRVTAIVLNTWLGAVLLVPGGPLAAPAVVNVLLLTWKRRALVRGA